ncbi:MAG: exodeoxyribonuclease I [Congregibacter sp.]
MSSSESFFWHDYETFGSDPSYDRPVQFAGQRTDADLNLIGEPLILYARPAMDYLPQPGACLITGITPQEAQAKGLSEAEFIRQIEQEMQRPGTCSLGYNSLRFDDTVTRFTLFRNLKDAYAREYGDSRSRWDLIDAMRTAYALRPEGIEWPLREDGPPSFRLEDLTRANGIDHGQAHDALADVTATIAIARLLRQAQPKLYTWLYEHRIKSKVQALLDSRVLEPVLHISGMFGAARGNLGLVLPVCSPANNRNEVMCLDLSIDAALFLDLSVDELKTRLYMPSDQMAEGIQRPGIKSLHLNRCPVILPPKMATAQVAERCQLDLDFCRNNLRKLRAHDEAHPGALRDKLLALHAASQRPPAKVDVDQSLYTGGFLSREDRASLDRLVTLSGEELAATTIAFQDTRLEEMLFRYRARNFIETLNDEELARWEEHRYLAITEGLVPGRNLEHFHTEIEGRLSDPRLPERDRQILDALQHWGDGLLG